MKLNCPDCGATFDFIQAMEDADGRRFVELITKLPPVTIKPFVRYLRLFKPEQKSLRWSRMLKLAQQINQSIMDAVVIRNGTSYVVTGQQWADVMIGLVDTPPKHLRLPLKSHGYLLEVLATASEKLASSREEKTEQAKRSVVARNIANKPQSINAVVENTNKPKILPPENWTKDVFKPTGEKT